MKNRFAATFVLLATLLLASCAAPISIEKIAIKTPVGNYEEVPLSHALREFEAGKAARDPMASCGHFLECARLAGDLAVAGEPGALALYNQATGLLVGRLEESNALPWNREITLGGGATLRGKREPGAPPMARRYINVASLKFAGEYASIHAARPGVGAPLIAIEPDDQNFRSTYGMRQFSKELTAVLRFDSEKSATLELHDPLDTDTISIAGHRPRLAADFSAPVSMQLSIHRPDKLGFVRLLNPQKYSDTAQLTRLQAYDKRRTPVLFVHGLDSTPATWTLMYHSLMQDPMIRKNYQFWVFSYPSGYPYPYAASLLRKELDGVRRAFPGSKDMVIIGHSMGGMISRLMVTDADDTIWRAMFGSPPAETMIGGHSLEILEDSVVFNHRTEIDTAIFMATPHKGSELSNHFIGRLFSRLIRLPTFITDTRNVIASILTADEASLQLERAPNSIDTLSPNNRFVREVNNLPIAPGVTYHSIIGDRGKGDTPDSSDGVVAYWSSRLDGAASEKIVPSGHGPHRHPEGIAEVARILRERL